MTINQKAQTKSNMECVEVELDVYVPFESNDLILLMMFEAKSLLPHNRSTPATVAIIIP